MPDEPSPLPVPFHIAAMRTWRYLAGLSLLLVVAGLIFALPLATVGAGLFLICAAISFFHMTVATWTEVHGNYALRQLLLAVLLLPVFGVGLFVVTRLVEADLIRWRLAERPPA